jgi:hypothetical protein
MCCLSQVIILQGNFNKLKMLQKVLNDTPPVGAGGVSWLWWLDIDTVVDPAQVCTFQRTQLWGSTVVSEQDLTGTSQN